jgi:predicted RNA-binding protein YlxR (DUF448 family)
VTKNTSKRTKHIPQRTCVGCRKVIAKRELMRIVHTPEGVIFDPTGKLSGRGVYLHNMRSCWEHGLKGAVAGALKTEISSGDMLTLKSIMANMPNENPEETGLPSKGTD